MACKYCERKPILNKYGIFEDYENEEIICVGTWSCISLGVDENGELVIVAHGDGPTYYYPKYCPECGRKVKQNEN